MRASLLSDTVVHARMAKSFPAATPTATPLLCLMADLCVCRRLGGSSAGNGKRRRVNLGNSSQRPSELALQRRHVARRARGGEDAHVPDEVGARRSARARGVGVAELAV